MRATARLVADAAYRAKINIPLDCRDGACGTCKCHCESGEYTMRRATSRTRWPRTRPPNGYVLTCQMRPNSDCVVRDAGLVGGVQDRGRRARRQARAASSATRRRPSSFTLQAERPLAFLPGQYVNLQVPGSKETRSYSFSSRAGRSRAVLPDPRRARRPDEHLHARARRSPGDCMMFTGPYGSFYLRPTRAPDPDARRRHRPRAVPVDAALAGGQRGPTSRSGWSTASTPTTTWSSSRRWTTLKAACRTSSTSPCVVDPDSGHPRKGYVTDAPRGRRICNGGEVDVYVCGPPPMVEGVRKWMRR